MQKKQNRTFTIVILLIVFAFSIVLFGRVTRYVGKTTVPTITRTPYQKLPAANQETDMHGMKTTNAKPIIVFKETAIELKNSNTSDYISCSLELNATTVMKGFMHNTQTVPAGKSVTIPLEEFTRNNESFNPSERNADNVMAMCQTNESTSWTYATNR